MLESPRITRFPSSFRDNAGFLIQDEGRLLRVITEEGRKDFDFLLSSGLYKKLVDLGFLIPHEEVPHIPSTNNYYKLIQPKKIPFISYPYEWSFSQFKDAALLTLEIQLEALQHGLSLKDASFFNVQFIGPRPVFIDTLSFEKREDTPWFAYRQFVEHFLAPLLMMSSVSVDYNRVLSQFLDGIPLNLASRLVPFLAQLKPGRFIHLFLHSKSQSKYKDNTVRSQRDLSHSRLFSLKRQMALIDSLKSTVAGIKIPKQKTEWIDYMEGSLTQGGNNYSEPSLEFKRKVVCDFLSQSKPGMVWDFGGNTGDFSRLATEREIYTVCFDRDPLCVEENYLRSQRKNDRFMLPLLIDLSNPTPSLGWAGKERMSLGERRPVDLIMVLALIHHLRITFNVPLKKWGDYFSSLTDKLLVEFIPKEDSMTKRLLQNRKDIFSDYTQEGFESAFGEFFPKKEVYPIPGSFRALYLFQK